MSALKKNVTRASLQTLIICPFLKTNGRGIKQYRQPKEQLLETVKLAQSLALEVSISEIVSVIHIRPATYLGKGTVARYKEIITDKTIVLTVIDCVLSPVQQRNLEQIWKTKVIDRTALILEIFSARAHTKEGVLQVELAYLSYKRSRLVKTWTHLERQRGGFGFLGGPGEAQIETDRRLISDRITQLRSELEIIRKTRGLHRRSRPYPVAVIVGYTNSGKSTLFNLLTQAKVFVADQLFATLDPTMRAVRLPSGRNIILSDTVGFISNLPHELIAAFRATLEEVISADFIIHVRDISHPDTEMQRSDVEVVLHTLGITEIATNRLVEVCNKIDLLSSESRKKLFNDASYNLNLSPLSAATGEGSQDLLSLLDRKLAESLSIAKITVPLEDGEAISWLYQHGEVLDSYIDDPYFHLRVRLHTIDLARLTKSKGYFSS